MGLFDRFRKKDNSFKYLDNLIHSGNNEILLDKDIINVDYSYSWGIKLDIDNLIIDGNDFSIDSVSKTPIFRITGNNIILRNITFKNGFSRNGGGSILNEANLLTIENCTFENNEANWGGAISNKGIKIIFKNCNFIENKGFGGIVHNSIGSLDFENCNFEENSSNGGGLFYSIGESIREFLNFHHCVFKRNFLNNVDEKNKSLFYNSETLKFENCLFEDNLNNNYQEDCQLFCNTGFLSLLHCSFSEDFNSNNELGLVNNNASVILKNSNFNTDLFNRFINNGFLEISSCNFKNSFKIDNQLLGDIYSNDDVSGIIINNGGTFHPHCNYKSFEKLNELINNGLKDIVLDSDYIFLQSDVELFGNDGIDIQIDDLIINGDGFSINAVGKSKIFATDGENIKIKNVNFRNGRSNSTGSAIRNFKSLTVENCYFKGNSCNRKHLYNGFDSDGVGGAISNYNHLIIKDSKFENNNSNRYGGAISNNNSNSSVICINSYFKNNSSFKGGSILNRGSIELNNCEFKGNFASSYGSDIFQEGTYSSSIVVYSSFLFNYDMNYDVIHIENGFFSDNSSKFVEDDSIYFNDEWIKSNSLEIHKSNSDRNSKFFFYNHEGTINLKKSIFDISDGNICFNNSLLKLNVDKDIKDLIVLTKKSEYIDLHQDIDKFYEDNNGFEYLESLILGENDEIILDKDIILNHFESSFYEGGIDLNKDNLIIDGQNHIIDANGLSRVFFVSAKNVTLKNIKFKNGMYFKNILDDEYCGGGIIYALKDTSLKIHNCEFIENRSSVSSSVIFNKGNSLEIFNSIFSNNNAEQSFGTICNYGKLSIEGSIFQNNNSKEYSGVICSFGEGEHYLTDCDFIQNSCFNGAGVISNFNTSSSFIYKNCIFKSNVSEDNRMDKPQGNLILDCGNLFSFESCNFENNEIHNDGSLIKNDGAKMLLKDCNFVNNDVHHSVVLFRGENNLFKIIGCSFDNNHSQLFGSIYFNADDSMLNIENSIFKYNRSHDVGAVFSCDGDNNAVTCKHCEFIENIAHMMAAVGYFAGHGYGNTVDLKDCTFANNVGKSYNSDFHAPYKENNFFLFEYCNFDCYSSNVLNYEANVSGYHSMGNRKFFNEKYLFVTRDPENYSENINIKNCIFKD